MRRKPRYYLAAAVVLCLAGISVVRGSLETKLVLPGSATQGLAGATVPPSPDYELIPLQTSDGTRIVTEFGGALGPDGKRDNAAHQAPKVICYLCDLRLGSWPKYLHSEHLCEKLFGFHFTHINI
jgi:hypothetical protein